MRVGITYPDDYLFAGLNPAATDGTQKNMITSFSVGARFQILDEASPALRVILRQVRDLNVALDKAREMA